MILPSSVGVLLAALAGALGLAWIALSAWLLVQTRREGVRRSAVWRVLAAFDSALEDTPGGSPDRLRAIVAPLSRDLVLRVSSALSDQDPRAAHYARAVAANHGLDWISETALRATGTPRHNWRRIAALRLLAHQDVVDPVPVLGQAVRDQEPEIVGAAIALLSQHGSAAAADHLIATLKSGHYAASRVATYLDRLPAGMGDRLLPLLHHPDANVRYWGITLLARHGSVPGLAGTMVALTHDPAPLVRRAAVAALARLDPERAAAPAQGLLSDPAWFVRVHAARAIGELGDPDLAESVAPLLADREWWVRTAAKEALQRMGTEIWSVLVPYLDHPDEFARNGAAEVLQNIGILDSLIVLEAATTRPSPAKLEMLRKIAAAGGTRMTEALLDRLDEHTRPRVLVLLENLGLEPVGAGV